MRTIYFENETYESGVGGIFKTFVVFLVIFWKHFSNKNGSISNTLTSSWTMAYPTGFAYNGPTGEKSDFLFLCSHIGLWRGFLLLCGGRKNHSLLISMKFVNISGVIINGKEHLKFSGKWLLLHIIPCTFSFPLSYLYLISYSLQYSFPISFSSEQQWKISAVLNAKSFQNFLHPYKHF
jgi:hypothetical protein